MIGWFGSNTTIDELRHNEDFKEAFVGLFGQALRNPLNTILTTCRRHQIARVKPVCDPPAGRFAIREL